MSGKLTSPHFVFREQFTRFARNIERPRRSTSCTMILTAEADELSSVLCSRCGARVDHWISGTRTLADRWVSCVPGHPEFGAEEFGAVIFSRSRTVKRP